MCSRRLFLSALIVLPMATALGCGGGNKPVPVSGVLQWEDGTPISQANITFWPKKEGMLAASALTRKDGTFELTTYNSGDGAFPGEYVVLVTKVKMKEEANVSVPASGEADPKDMIKKMKEFIAQSKGQQKTALEIPAVYGKAESSPLKWKVDDSTSGVKLKISKQ
jgi:hypothetical protein